MFSNEFKVWGGVRRLKSDHQAIAAALESIQDGATWRSWRAAWRLHYKAISAEIRSLRASMKDPAMSSGERSDAQSRRHSGRVAAANMMLLLDAAKQHRPARRQAA